MRKAIDKETARLRSKEWRKKNKEKHAAYNKEYRDNNPDYYSQKATKYNRLKLYGFTTELYEQRLLEQGYCCGICNKHISEFDKSFAADHSHDTHKPRGLLCNACNLMLGFAHDNVEILASAILYLQRYK